MTAECRALVSGYYDTASVGMRVLKGIPRPVEVFRLIGLKPAIASQQFRNSSLAPLYGRENELGVLKQALWDAEQGTTSIIGIRGSAGVGKSRLCFEFSEWCRRRQIGVSEARALIYGQATPLLPVLEMMRAFFRIRPGLDPATARQRVEEKLLAADISLPDLSILLDFLGVPVSESAGQAIDSKVRHARLREHIRCIVRAIGRRTAVIVFEDLHWLDESSQDFIDTIVEAVNGTKIVVVLTYRPEWRPRWAFRSDYRELPLRELDRFQTGQ